ncbi:hypothetical protein [Sandarakinorhabdus sp.]|uniref:hypothetical protein n=1 Tax=Sandarakinorhabdus sp. TaxID=1916663 RepID=UPI003342A6DE
MRSMSRPRFASITDHPHTCAIYDHLLSFTWVVEGKNSVFNGGIAPLGRADACAKQTVRLDNVPWAEAEKIILVFMILGWQVSMARPAGLIAAADLFATSPSPSPPPPSPSWAGKGQFDQLTADLLADSSADSERPRLVLRGEDRIIRVTTADPALVPVLAAAGVDRLVMPVALPAIEQLMVLAG